MNAVVLDLVRDGFEVRLRVHHDLLVVTLSKRIDDQIHSIARAHDLETPSEYWAFDLSRARHELEQAVKS